MPPERARTRIPSDSIEFVPSPSRSPRPVAGWRRRPPGARRRGCHRDAGPGGGPTRRGVTMRSPGPASPSHVKSRGGLGLGRAAATTRSSIMMLISQFGPCRFPRRIAGRAETLNGPGPGAHVVIKTPTRIGLRELMQIGVLCILKFTCLIAHFSASFAFSVTPTCQLSQSPVQMNQASPLLRCIVTGDSAGAGSMLLVLSLIKSPGRCFVRNRRSDKCCVGPSRPSCFPDWP